MRFTIAQLLLLATLVAVTGCLPSEQAPTLADFRANDAQARVPAIVNAAENDDPQELAELVHALSDKDPAVRLFAIQALQERTGETRGYRYYESSAKRQAAVTRWHDWLKDPLTPQPDEAVSDNDNPNYD